MINYIKRLWRSLLGYKSKPVNSKWKKIDYPEHHVVRFTDIKKFNNAVYGRHPNDKRTYILEDGCEAFDKHFNK